MTECIILQLCKTLLSSFSCTVQVSAFKESTQQNQKKKDRKGQQKQSRDGALQEDTRKTWNPSVGRGCDGDYREKKSHGGCGS